MHGLARYSWIGFAVVFPLLAPAACPDHAAVVGYVADFEAARLSRGFGNDLSLADAQCAKGKLVQELPQVQGRVVGYKAAFTNPALQQRFGVTSPAWGVMFAKMMVDSGAKLPARFGARPLYEANFVAVVRMPPWPTPRPRWRLGISQWCRSSSWRIMLEGSPQGTALIATNIGFREAPWAARDSRTGPASLSAANATIVMTEDTSGRNWGANDVLMGIRSCRYGLPSAQEG